MIDAPQAARSLLLDGRFADAATLLEAHLAGHPADPVAWRRLAGARLGLREREAALVAAGRALELDPADGISSRHRARALLGLKRYPEMLDEAERAAVLRPADPDALVLLGYGVLLVTRDRPRVAEICRQALAADPAFPGAIALRRSLRTGRWRGLVVGTGPAAAAGLMAMIGGVLLLQPRAPQTYWMLGGAGLFLAVTLGVRVAARLRLPYQAAGPGALAGSGVVAAVLAGGAALLGVGSVRAGVAVELLTALLAAVFSIKSVQAWRRHGRVVVRHEVA